MNELDSVIQEFLLESHENLDRLDRDLVRLEQDPGNKDELANIFRTIHTIKGTCGFFDFTKLGAITHSGENLLSRMRDGELQFNPSIADGLLHLVDSIRAILANIEASGDEGNENYSALIDQLNRLQLANRACESALIAPCSSPETVPPPVTSAATTPTHRLSDCNIRVDVGLLDKLMNRVGELVLARNQILQSPVLSSDAGLLSMAQRLNLITTELQEGVMKTRMQPICGIWNKFPRFVRDLSLTCGKQVRIEMEGKETELDRTIVEAIRDPLTHLVRNAVDHGIESPELRTARGKPPLGLLRLRAFHEGGQVNIEISDDGAGIDIDRIKRRAIERKLLTNRDADQLSERELLHLIFMPGFSTAERVTDVSGRGVGMDVVKTNIEKVGGALDIQSHPGRGTTFSIKLPLTLAIIPALTVTSGGDRYVIPQVNLLKLIRLEGKQVRREVEDIRGSSVYRLRGNLLPLVYLNRELCLDGKANCSSAQPANSEKPVYIIVLQADDRQFGLVVDDINDTEEIIVKPLDKQLKTIPLFAGVTILGDGRVALILDVLGVAQRARVVTDVNERPMAAEPTLVGRPSSSQESLILLELNCRRRAAVPLANVLRLETFPAGAVEWTSRREVVQYRGQILPLIRLDELFPEQAQAASHPDALHVVICRQNERTIGLVVGRVIDIVSTALDVQRSDALPGIVGSAIIHGRVTSLVSVPQIADAIDSISLRSAVAG